MTVSLADGSVLDVCHVSLGVTNRDQILDELLAAIS